MIILLLGKFCVVINYTFKLEKNHYIYVEKVLNFFRLFQLLQMTKEDYSKGEKVEELINNRKIFILRLKHLKLKRAI